VKYPSSLLICLLAALAAGAAQAQQYAYPPVPPDYQPVSAPPSAPAFSQQDLDQLLAPVALYSDPLLSQVLMAATYPLEVVQAARFMQQNPGLSGDALAQSLQYQNWDPSVKSLTQFPTVLAMMNDQLDWMQRLGDAFLSQQTAVMDTVQSLRAKARAAGTLASNQQQSVQIVNGAIDIEPYSPDVIYVPYYDPVVVYGPWWWPQRPFVWAPPSYYGYVPSYGVGFSVGVSINIGTPLFVFSRPDWGGHHFVTYSGPPHFSPGGQSRPGRPGWSWPSGGNTVWTHNPEHRMGVAYRDAATSARFHAQPQPQQSGGREIWHQTAPAAPAPATPAAAHAAPAPNVQPLQQREPREERRENPYEMQNAQRPAMPAQPQPQYAPQYTPRPAQAEAPRPVYTPPAPAPEAHQGNQERPRENREQGGERGGERGGDRKDNRERDQH